MKDQRPLKLFHKDAFSSILRLDAKISLLTADTVGS